MDSNLSNTFLQMFSQRRGKLFKGRGRNFSKRIVIRGLFVKFFFFFFLLMITCIAPKRNIFFALLYTINTYKENQFLGNFCKNIIIFSIENFP